MKRRASAFLAHARLRHISTASRRESHQAHSRQHFSGGGTRLPLTPGSLDLPGGGCRVRLSEPLGILAVPSKWLVVLKSSNLPVSGGLAGAVEEVGDLGLGEGLEGRAASKA